MVVTCMLDADFEIEWFVIIQHLYGHTTQIWLITDHKHVLNVVVLR